MYRRRRLNPMIFLTICCALLVITIFASLIVFTLLPIFSKVQGNQVKYQSIVSSSTLIDYFLFAAVQSEVLRLIYNLPDRLAILPMNWTYATVELDANKLSILQDLVFVLFHNK